MRFSESTRSVILALAAGCLLGAAAQTPAPPADSAPDSKITTLHVATHITVVDITVTDKSGEPVHGLTQADFTVLEDGKPQPLRSFGEYGTQPVRQVPPTLPLNVYSNLQASPTSSAVNIFLIDPMSTAPGDSNNMKAVARSIQVQNAVKQGAMDYLKTMPAGTRVAVFSLTENLRMLQGFTSDGALLSAAVNTQEVDTLGRASTKEMRQMQAESRNRSALEALREIAVFASRIKGRKNLIWFTVGIPAVTASCGLVAGLPDYGRDLSNTYAELAAAQVAIYPVDVQGVEGGIGCGQLSEDTLAEATGGVAFHGSNDLRQGVAKAVDNGANYYTVSYIPPDPKLNGKYHAISVKLDRPGLQLVYRKGYFADDLSKYSVPAGVTVPSEVPVVHNNDMKAAMSRSVPISTALLFEVHIEPATAPRKSTDPPILGTPDAKLKGKPLMRYDFQYVLPARQLAFTDGAKGTHHGSVDFDIAAYDVGGKLLTGLSQTVDMPLSASTYRQLITGPMRFFQQIDLPAGALFLRVGVLDRTSQKTGTLELPLAVAKK